MAATPPEPRDPEWLAARPTSLTNWAVLSVGGAGSARRADRLVTEEPLEIRVRHRSANLGSVVTMRTPGSDFELAAGYLLSEGVVSTCEEISSIRYCTERELGEQQRFNVVTVELRSRPEGALQITRPAVSAACGVCGKASIAELQTKGFPPLAAGPVVDGSVISALPESLRARQRLFDATGGLHAAGIFTPNGAVVAVREDIGRHNALDKLLGWCLLNHKIPLADHLVMVSGRASYEMVQKCLVAGVPMLCAVSAPSSLAARLAQEFSMTLAGFVRHDGFNIYSGESRVDVRSSTIR